MAHPPIDLRSDTVTRPTPGMRRAIAEAEVGDDMMGEDPTVNQLEQRICELLGKPAAVYACSGTQANQMAIRAVCAQGEELLIDETGHIALWEAGAAAALSGVTVRTLRGDGGRLDLEQLEGQLRPDNVHFCKTRLVCLENTTNQGGGRVYPHDQLLRIFHWARQHQVAVHLDGARLFNASIASGLPLSTMAACADTVSLCFSKGLGCPMGSIVAGEPEVIARARRARKIFGGALRQAGMMAAAALYALEHHVERLADDHAHARMLAEEIADIPGLRIDLNEVESNLVFFEVDPAWGTGGELAARLREDGVLTYATGPQRLRACTHLDIGREQIVAAARTLRSIMTGRTRAVAVPADLAY